MWRHCEREPERTNIYAEQTIHAQERTRGLSSWQQITPQAQGYCKGLARVYPSESKGYIGVAGTVTAGQKTSINEL